MVCLFKRIWTLGQGLRVPYCRVLPCGYFYTDCNSAPSSDIGNKTGVVSHFDNVCGSKTYF